MVVLIERKRSRWTAWALALLVFVVMAGVAWWAWSWQPEDLMVSAPSAAAMAPAMPETLVGADEPPVALGASGPPVDAEAWRQQAEQAERAVVGGWNGASPVPPLQGPVNERPSYVSLIEWMALKSAAQQHADPDAELTRLVNFLRFMRLRDVLDDLPAGAIAQRQTLVATLLGELPQHVRQGNIGRAEALSLQTQWLTILQPDEQVRAEMTRQEAARLNGAP